MKLSIVPEGIGLALVMLAGVSALRYYIVISFKESFLSRLRPYRRFFNLIILVISKLGTIAWIAANDFRVSSIILTWYIAYFAGLMLLLNYIFVEE